MRAARYALLIFAQRILRPILALKKMEHGTDSQMQQLRAASPDREERRDRDEGF
jgi:hypothetical protein